MKLNRRALVSVILLVLSLSVHLYSRNENRVETGYSNGFFLQFSHFLRLCFGKIPFSIGDILYGLLVCWLSWQLIKFFSGLYKKKGVAGKREFYRNTFYRVWVFCCSMYIIFNLFWGINYNRKGIAWQTGIGMKPYTASDLFSVNRLITEQVNHSKQQWLSQKKDYPGNPELFSIVNDAYAENAVAYPFLRYEQRSLKSSMWGWFGNYAGFTGYYNPFTGEAQVNTTVPRFLQPFIACHEVAHQIGYAKENEASFVGFLVAENSKNPLLQYSVYLELFMHVNSNLYAVDSLSAKKFRDSLMPAVKNDILAWREFNRQHRSFAEPLITWIYDKYLLGNEQPGGILSYDEVTGFVINYYKRSGRL